jgi:hypothetical protein
MTTSLVKGISLLTNLKVVDKLFGAEAHRAILTRLPADLQALFHRKELMALAWYPFAWFYAFHEALAQVVGPHAAALVGRAATKEDVNLFFQFILRAASPEFIIRTAAKSVLSSYTRGFVLQTLSLEKGTWELRAGWEHEDSNDGMMDDLLATLQTFIELTGTPGVHFEQLERTPRHIHTVYRW